MHTTVLPVKTHLRNAGGKQLDVGCNPAGTSMNFDAKSQSSSGDFVAVKQLNSKLR